MHDVGIHWERATQRDARRKSKGCGGERGGGVKLCAEKVRLTREGWQEWDGREFFTLVCYRLDIAIFVKMCMFSLFETHKLHLA